MHLTACHCAASGFVIISWYKIQVFVSISPLFQICDYGFRFPIHDKFRTLFLPNSLSPSVHFTTYHTLSTSAPHSHFLCLFFHFCGTWMTCNITEYRFLWFTSSNLILKWFVNLFDPWGKSDECSNLLPPHLYPLTASKYLCWPFSRCLPTFHLVLFV